MLPKLKKSSIIMSQMSDGDSYYEDLMQYVLYIRCTSRQNVLRFMNTQAHLLNAILPPPPTDFFIHFAKKKNLQLKVIFDAINIYDRFFYRFIESCKNNIHEQYQTEIIREIFSNYTVLDMILCIALAISFDISDIDVGIPLPQISAMCRMIGRNYSLQFIRTREWFIFVTIGLNVRLPSLLDLTSHIYMMLSYKFQDIIVLENLEDVLLSHIGIYYKYRKNIFHIIKTEIQKESSAKKKKSWWYYANGDISFAAAVITLSSISQLADIQFKELPEELFACLEKWLDVNLSSLSSILIFMWEICHPQFEHWTDGRGASRTAKC